MPGIAVNNFGQLDLNLLRTLDVLLAEHNVTRAAQRLHLAQPSVSAQLARLRTVFGDPLLLPGPRGMRATAKADALREPLRQALAALAQAVSPVAPFDPGKADHTWRIAATDYTEATIIIPALRELRSAAPGTRLAVVSLAPATIAKQAEQGEIDVAFHTSHDAPPGLRRRALFTERYVLVGRADHPRLKRKPTTAQFCRLEHVITSTTGGAFHGVTDDALAQVGLVRRVVLSVPHFTFVRTVIESTDLVAMLPERIVRGNEALRVVEPPVDVPGFEMSMLWHERSHRDPAHRWLRECVANGVDEGGRSATQSAPADPTRNGLFF